MDDKNFDDLIRNKLGDYEDQGFDPEALAGFHSRMAAQVHYPWYVRYRNELITAAATLFIGALLLWGQSEMHSQGLKELSLEIQKLRDQNEALMLSDSEVKESRVDTVRVVEYRESDQVALATLREQIRRLETRLTDRQNDPTFQFNDDEQLLYMGRSEDIPEEALRKVSARHQLIEREGYLFMVLNTGSSDPDRYPYIQRKNLITSRFTLPDYEFYLDSISTDNSLELTSEVRRETVKLPVRQLREMEEQRFGKGLGIEIGPVLEVYESMYDPGSRQIAYGGGIMANFITSPRLSFETGILLHSTEYVLTNKDVSELNLPPADPQYGFFQGAEITPWFLEFPVNIKYRYRISASNHVIGSAGISGFLFTREEFEYLYRYDAGNGFIIPVETSFREKESRFQPGTANLALGLSSLLKNGKRLEAMVFYKRNLSPLGLEEVDASFFGVRTAYQFTLR